MPENVIVNPIIYANLKRKGDLEVFTVKNNLSLRDREIR